MRTSVSLATERGIREKQDDSIGIFRLASWECFAIADGYGPLDPSGKQLSCEVIAIFLQAATTAIEHHQDITPENYKYFFADTFALIDQKTTTFTSGSTLAVALHNRRDHTFYTAALGDSILAHLTPTDIKTNPFHNLHLGKENLWGSFGDTANAQHHQKQPECHHFIVQPYEALLIASDGLFPGHGDTVTRELQHYRQLILEENISASELVTIAHLEKQTDDNASAIIIRILEKENYTAPIPENQSQ